MLDLIKKSFDAALGALSVTQEKMKELADELVLKGHLSRKEGADLLKELKKSARDGQSRLSSLVEDQVKKTMRDMGVATNADLKALKGKLERLEKELAREKKAKSAAKKMSKEKRGAN